MSDQKKQNFYKVDEYYTEKFYQMPQVLFTSPKYKDMSNDARVMYALLKDRNSYSIRNHWFDEDGNIYFIFTNKELMEMLNCSAEKLSRLKKELIKKDLLFQKRMGLRKPNRLYLIRPEVTAQDVYVQEKKEQELENRIPEVNESANTNTKKDESEFKKRDIESEVGSENIEYNYFDVFSKDSLSRIQLLANNSDLEVEEIKKLIFQAKGKALHDVGFLNGSVLDVKDFPNFIKTTLHGVIKAVRSNKIHNLKGYIYTSFYKGFYKLAVIYNVYSENVEYDELANVTEQKLMNFYSNSKVELGF